MRCRATGTIADVWAVEQAALMPLPLAFDGFVELSKRVSPSFRFKASSAAAAQKKKETNPPLTPA
jgi:hypothetical protein